MNGVPPLGVAGGDTAAFQALAFELAAAAPGTVPDIAACALPDAGTADAPERDAIIVIDADSTAIHRAVAAGCALLCLPGGRADPADIASVTAGAAPGFALVLSCLRHTPAGQRAAQALASGRLGGLLSAYMSFRVPPGGRQPSLAAMTWEALDCAAMLTSAPPARVHTAAAEDLLTIIICFADGLVVTADLSRGLPGPAMTEAEIELVGDRGLIRAEPYRPAVHVQGCTGTAGFPFGTSPVRGMLAGFLAALADPGRRELEQDRQRRVLTLASAVASSSSVTGGLGSWPGS